MGRKPRPKIKFLGTKLKQIRENGSLTQPNMFKVLRPKGNPNNHSIISEYERGLREPCLRDVFLYSEFGKVSCDVLLDDAISDIAHRKHFQSEKTADSGGINNSEKPTDAKNTHLHSTERVVEAALSTDALNANHNGKISSSVLPKENNGQPEKPDKTPAPGVEQNFQTAISEKPAEVAEVKELAEVLELSVRQSLSARLDDVYLELLRSLPYTCRRIFTKDYLLEIVIEIALNDYEKNDETSALFFHAHKNSS